MVHFKSFESFYNFVDQLKKDDISFKIIGHSYEHFSGMHFNEQPENNKWTMKLVLLSGIGSFYLSESVKISDTDKISDIKSKLGTLQITNGEVTCKEGIVLIK